METFNALKMGFSKTSGTLGTLGTLQINAGGCIHQAWGMGPSLYG
jgi:hypothetical protein